MSCVCELCLLFLSESVCGVCISTLDCVCRYDDGPPFMVHPTLLVHRSSLCLRVVCVVSECVCLWYACVDFVRRWSVLRGGVLVVCLCV